MLSSGRVVVPHRPPFRRRATALALGVALLGVVGIVAVAPDHARAGQAATDASPGAPRGALLSVTVDKAHILRLDHDASLVMVADPDIADVTVQSPRLLFILGRAPGETNLYVLDGKGREILNTALVVVPNNEREVTINRNLSEGTLSCDPRCARVPTPRADDTAAAAGAAADGATGSAASAGGATSRSTAADTSPGAGAPPGGILPSPNDEALNPEYRGKLSIN